MQQHSIYVEGSERDDLTAEVETAYLAKLSELGKSGGSTPRRMNGTAVDGRPGIFRWWYRFSTDD